MRSAYRILALLLLSAAAAAVHVPIRGLSWKPDVSAIEKKQGLRSHVNERHAELRRTVGIDLDAFIELIDAGAVVIDARPRSEFEKQHLSISSYPPVLNVEPEHIERNLDRLFQLQGQPIVLYCTAPDCELAEELYVAMESFGLSGMKIYFPGWEGILAAGLPTESGPDEWSGYEPADDGADSAETGTSGEGDSDGAAEALGGDGSGEGG